MWSIVPVTSIVGQGARRDGRRRQDIGARGFVCAPFWRWAVAAAICLSLTGGCGDGSDHGDGSTGINGGGLPANNGSGSTSNNGNGSTGISGSGSSSSNGGGSTSGGASLTGLWATGYYPAYEANNMPVSAIPYNSLTHLIHFALVPAHVAQANDRQDTRGTPGTLTDPFGLQAQTSVLVATAHAAGVKVLLGIGGDSSVNAGLGFEQGTTAANRATLVRNIVDALASGNYDGVDINWEGIVLGDGSMPNASAFHAFISDLRSALDQHAPPTHYVLSFPSDTSSNYTVYSNYADLLVPVVTAFDQINLQTYLMAGAYQGWVTWFNSPLSNNNCFFPDGTTHAPSIDQTVQAFISKSIPSRKLGMGIQFVGTDWQGGSGMPDGGADGPCESWTYGPPFRSDGTDPGAPAPVRNFGFVPQINAADVIRNELNDPTFGQFFDDETRNNAQMPFLAKNESGSANDHFLNYEDDRSIKAKADYIKAQNLGGMMMFEIAQDYLSERSMGDAQHPLMTSVRQHVVLGPSGTPTMTGTPAAGATATRTPMPLATVTPTPPSSVTPTSAPTCRAALASCSSNAQCCSAICIAGVCL